MVQAIFSAVWQFRIKIETCQKKAALFLGLQQ